MVFLHAADTEDYQIDLDWGVKTNGYNSLISRVKAAKDSGRSEISFNNCRYGQPATALPVRFFIGGVDWQVHVRLPVRYVVANKRNQVILNLKATISEDVKKFFGSLPSLVGVGIHEDLLQWSKAVDAIWGVDLVGLMGPPIEMRDLLHLAGINMGQTNMMTINWWVLGSILPKGEASRGENQ